MIETPEAWEEATEEEQLRDLMEFAESFGDVLINIDCGET